MTHKQMNKMRVKLTVRDMYHTSLGITALAKIAAAFAKTQSLGIMTVDVPDVVEKIESITGAEGQFIGQTSFAPRYDFVGVKSKTTDCSSCWRGSNYCNGCCTKIGDACRVGERNNQYSTACEAGSESYQRPYSQHGLENSCIDGWSSEGKMHGRLQKEEWNAYLVDKNRDCTGWGPDSCVTTDVESVTGQYDHYGVWTEAPSVGQNPRILYDVYFETPEVNNKPIRDNTNDANPETHKTRFPEMADPTYTERTSGLVKYTDSNYMPCGRDDSAYFGDDETGLMDYLDYKGRIQSYFGADISFALGSATLPFAVGEYTPSAVINSHPYIY
jgi:hypothetical protein